MSKRKAISKSVRFEVFKRDSFKCQYCGAAAPDVLLEVDHIHPVAQDGKNDITNLITACNGCNAGKSDRLLSDDAVANKRKRQLDDLQVRREQLEMMAEWQRGMLDLTGLAVRNCADLFNQMTPGYGLNQSGLEAVRKYVLRFGQAEVMEAIRKAARYLETVDGKLSLESIAVAFQKIGGICVIERRVKDDPDLSEVYRLRSLITKRAPSIQPYVFMTDMKSLREVAGYTMPEIRQRLESVYKWYEYRDAITEMMADRGFSL